jgi:hypothetical protein
MKNKILSYLIRVPYCSLIIVLIMSSFYIYSTLTINHDLLFVYRINLPAIILSALLAVIVEYKKSLWFIVVLPIVFFIMPFVTYIYAQHEDYKIIFYSLLVCGFVSIIIYLYLLVFNRMFIKQSNNKLQRT